MLVVSNTSPISNLALIGPLHLIRKQFGEIWIPPAVHSELNRLSHPEALAEILQAVQEGWIKPQALREDKVVQLLSSELDPGEAEAYRISPGAFCGSDSAGRKRRKKVLPGALD